jgi:hypothetical protein
VKTLEFQSFVLRSFKNSQKGQQKSTLFLLEEPEGSERKVLNHSSSERAAEEDEN